MLNRLAWLEMALITSPLLKPLAKDFISSNMGGEILKGGILDIIRAERLFEVSGDTVFIFGAGIGNDLGDLSKNEIKQIVGIDLTDKYKNAFLQNASELNLKATLEVGNILDQKFTQDLIAKYGRPQSIVIVFTLCCIRHPYQILQHLSQLLADHGNVFVIEHVADLGNIKMLKDQQKYRDDWMEVTGGDEHGGCDVTMDLIDIFGRTDLLIDDIKLYKDNRLLLKFAAFQQPIMSLKAHK